MEIKDIIDLSLIDAKMCVNTKEEVLKSLSKLLLDNNYITDINHFLNDVYKRESEGQTGIGNLIAIPHGKSDFVNKVGVAIAINNKEIPWESLDDHGAKATILFAVGNDNEGTQEHLKILSLFARKLGNDEVVKKLLAAKEAADVVAAFN